VVEHLKFVNNYRDLSTNQSFQYEFVCDRCGSGYRTTFKPSVTGKINGTLDTASSIFAGILGRAASFSDQVHSAAWKRAHNERFTKAVRGIKPYLVQCPRCNNWVCREKCWNVKKGLCKNSITDLGIEMAAAQASRSIEEVWTHAAMTEEEKELGKEYWREEISSTCPNCGKLLAVNAKFSSSCSFSLKSKDTCQTAAQSCSSLLISALNADISGRLI